MEDLRDKALFSVIIPIYGIAAHIQNLSKIVEQTATINCNLIIIHDSSDCESGNLIDNLVEKMKMEQIEVYHGNFSNPGGARNFGLSKVKTKWTIFSDADDSPKLELIAKAILSYSSFEVIMGTFTKIKLNVASTVFRNDDLFDIGINPGVWRFIFQTRKLNNIEFPLLKMGEDQVFLAKVDLENSIQIQESLYEYRIGSEFQLTSKLTKNTMADLVQANQLLYEIAVNSRNYITVARLFFWKTSMTILLHSNFKTKLEIFKRLYSSEKINLGNNQLKILSRIFVFIRFLYRHVRVRSA